MKRFLIGLAALTAITSAPAVQAFSITPTRSIGNVRTYEGQPDLYLSSGSRSRLSSSLSRWLEADVVPYGPSGSIALFSVQPGRYRFTWRLYTNLNEDSDALLLWNGQSFQLLALSSDATQRHEDLPDRVQTKWQTSTVTTETGKLAFLAMDGNRRWDTTMKISHFEKMPVPEFGTVVGMIAGGILMLWSRGKTRQDNRS
jgi:hypothetical protein